MTKTSNLVFEGIVHTDCFLNRNVELGWITIPILLDLNRKGLKSKKFKKVRVNVEFIK